MSTTRHQTPFNRRQPLYQQVADRLRFGLVRSTPAGHCLPSDRELASLWHVSTRTVREALLVLEAEGRIQRQQGRGSVVCPAPLPVALFSNLNLLDAATPRFFGSLLCRVRSRLDADGQPTRIYAGRSQGDSGSSTFSCPELVADAEAGRLAGIVALTSELDDPRLERLRQQSFPMVHATGTTPLAAAFGPDRIPAVAVPYLAAQGRRRIGLIGWNPPGADGHGPLIDAFARALAAHGLTYHPEWCRVDIGYVSPGAGWEAFREIWFAATDKPDALLVADENYLPEVIMAILQLGVRVPEDLLVISHQTRDVALAPAIPVARVEEDIELFADLLTGQVRAALAGRPAPVPAMPAGREPHRLVPLPDRARQPQSQSTTRNPIEVPS